jgi:hypothetical protein
MKCLVLLSSLHASSGHTLTNFRNIAVPETSSETRNNVQEVLKLLRGVALEIQKDGTTEQQEFDRYSCWCEKTIANKTENMKMLDNTITETERTILDLRTAVGTIGAEIEHLKKTVDEYIKELNDEAASREAQKKKAQTDGEEVVRAIEALDQAIQVLKSGAPQQKKVVFLGAAQKAQVMNVAGDLQKVVAMPLVRGMLSPSDQDVMRSFLAEHAGARLLSALQSGKEEDFSGIERVMGICVRMLEDFMSDLERLHGGDLQKEHLYREFKSTKENELATTQETLAELEQTHASDKVKLADSEEIRDSSKEELEADKRYFNMLVHDCQAKAVQWSEVSKYRAETLVGLEKAKTILSHDVFTGTSLLQVSAGGAPLHQALLVLDAVTSAHPAMMQYTVNEQGSIKAVVHAIDKMLVALAEEEKNDIVERDTCQTMSKSVTDGIEDDSTQLSTLSTQLVRSNFSLTELQTSLAACETEKLQIQQTINETTILRQLDEASLKGNVKECNAISEKLREATRVVAEAIHETNPVPAAKKAEIARPEIAFVQNASDEAAQYTIDPFKAPAGDFDGLGSHAQEKQGIVMILKMIETDNTKRCEQLVAINHEEDVDHDALVRDSQTSLMEKSSVCDNIQKQIVDLQGQVNAGQQQANQVAAEKAAKETTLESLNPRCTWVLTSFDSRKSKRAAEIQGLRNAKSYLSGGTAA